MSSHDHLVAGSHGHPEHTSHVKRSHGFSLIEITIVMAIIGLIVGGIIAGQSLYRASILRSVVEDTNHYISAYNMFLEKYGYRPGDMPNATEFWGAADPDPGTCSNTIGIGALTCNGNGNGKIQYDNNEEFRAWQHLANAGFIKAQYTGVGTGMGNWEANPGINVPASRVDGAGYSIFYMDRKTDPSSCELVGDYGHLFAFGGHGINNKTKAMILTPSEALSIDQKMDDAKPGLGFVRTMRGGCQPNCSTSQNVNTSVYNTAYKNIACMFYIIIEE